MNLCSPPRTVSHRNALETCPCCHCFLPTFGVSHSPCQIRSSYVSVYSLLASLNFYTWRDGRLNQKSIVCMERCEEQCELGGATRSGTNPATEISRNELGGFGRFGPFGQQAGTRRHAVQGVCWVREGAGIAARDRIGRAPWQSERFQLGSEAGRGQRRRNGTGGGGGSTRARGLRRARPGRARRSAGRSAAASAALPRSASHPRATAGWRWSAPPARPS